ncbi:MAG: DUF2318 domain-containing protein [Nitrospirae bacterium]|nr:MAG: DUF2318 domain-containing protein [Nitrospirota bacterium]
MKPVPPEIIFGGLKEALKLWAVFLFSWSFFKKEGRRGLVLSVLAGFLLSAVCSVILIKGMTSSSFSLVLEKSTGYSFGVLYLISLFLFVHYSGTDLLGPLKGAFSRGGIGHFFVFMLSALYFFPDVSGGLIYLGDQVRLSEGYERVFVFLGGLMVSLLALVMITTRGRGGRVFGSFTGMFDAPQLLLFFSLLKLLTGGVGGVGDITLVPTVQAGIMKLIHDMVHQTFVLVMVPDHMILSTTTWNFVGFIFRETFALYLSLVVLFLPLFVVMRAYVAAPVEAPMEFPTKAERRKYIKSVKNERLLKSIPAVVFLVIILGVWLSQKGEDLSRLYNPEPQPLVAESGELRIPISTPSGDLRDGMLHKYSVEVDGDTVRIMVMKRPDGSLSVMLDACEICPPEGYAQGEGHLVCLYCRTPIAFDTLGKRGGCNPIPVSALIGESEITIKVSDIEKEWIKVKTGGSKDVLR